MKVKQTVMRIINDNNIIRLAIINYNLLNINIYK